MLTFRGDMQPFSLAVESRIDHILDHLSRDGFCIVDQLHSQGFLNTLYAECLANLDHFRAAAVQDGLIRKVRSDYILWIEENLSVAQQHVDWLETFSEELNRAFFLGIQDIEAHFACYDAGQFYALHRDNPQQKNNRVISSVYYLHPTWQSEWGGQLRLQDRHQNWHIIEPEPNRMVLFQSDLLHEVLLSKQQRLSITAWLRNQQNILPFDSN